MFQKVFLVQALVSLRSRSLFLGALYKVPSLLPSVVSSTTIHACSSCGMDLQGRRVWRHVDALYTFPGCVSILFKLLQLKSKSQLETMHKQHTVLLPCCVVKSNMTCAVLSSMFIDMNLSSTRRYSPRSPLRTPSPARIGATIKRMPWVSFSWLDKLKRITGAKKVKQITIHMPERCWSLGSCRECLWPIWPLHLWQELSTSRTSIGHKNLSGEFSWCQPHQIWRWPHSWCAGSCLQAAVTSKILSKPASIDAPSLAQPIVALCRFGLSGAGPLWHGVSLQPNRGRSPAQTDQHYSTMTVECTLKHKQTHQYAWHIYMCVFVCACIFSHTHTPWPCCVSDCRWLLHDSHVPNWRKWPGTQLLAGSPDQLLLTKGHYIYIVTCSQ